MREWVNVSRKEIEKSRNGGGGVGANRQRTYKPPGHPTNTPTREEAREKLGGRVHTRKVLRQALRKCFPDDRGGQARQMVNRFVKMKSALDGSLVQP